MNGAEPSAPALNGGSGGVRRSRRPVDSPPSAITSLSPVSSRSKTLPARADRCGKQAVARPVARLMEHQVEGNRRDARGREPVNELRVELARPTVELGGLARVPAPTRARYRPRRPRAGGVTGPRAVNNAPSPSTSSSTNATGSRLAMRPIRPNARPSFTARRGGLRGGAETNSGMEGFVAHLTHHGTRLIVSSTH